MGYAKCLFLNDSFFCAGFKARQFIITQIFEDCKRIESYDFNDLQNKLIFLFWLTTGPTCAIVSI
jgi:hypothetical protein